MSTYRGLAGTVIGTSLGALIALTLVGATFYVVINNQAWPTGGDPVSDSNVLFILALLPGWSFATVATVASVRRLTPFLGGSTPAALTIALIALAASALLSLLVLLSWDN